MTGILQDLRYGLRMLWSRPWFTLVAVAILALGIGGTTTVFSWIDFLLLRPLPGVPSASALYCIETVAPDHAPLQNSYPDYRDVRDHTTTLSGFALAVPNAFTVGEDEAADRVWGESVSGNYFSVLGVTPSLGRAFLSSEVSDAPGKGPVVVISDRLWRTRFHSDPGVVGRSLRVSRHVLTIVGVAPPEFGGSMPGLTFDMWVPYMMSPVLLGTDPYLLGDRKTRNMIGLARLKPGVSPAAAQTELSNLAAQLAKDNPYTNGSLGFAIMPIWQGHAGAQTLLVAPLRILSVVCCVVMLIVCFNLTNMLLARATARQNEFSVRTALGASRWRVGRQVLLEVLLLTLLGAFAGVTVAVFTGPTLSYLFPPTEFPISLNIEPNGEVIAFAVLLCVVVAMVAAIVPVWHATDSQINDKLKEGARTQGGSRGSGRVRTALVVAEVALAFVALIGAGLFAKSFRAVSHISPGFNPEGVEIARFHLSGNGYDVPARKQFFRELRRRAESTPGVTAVSYSDVAPMGLDAGWWEDTGIEGYVAQPGENMKLFRSVIAPGYFRVMDIPLLDGRDFTDLDDEQSERVAIVNQEFVRKFIPTGNPIGRHLHGWGKDFRIVGVAQDSKYLQLTEKPRPFYYVPFQQIYRGDMQMSFYVRSRASAAETLASIRQQVRGIDPSVQVLDAMPMAEYLAASLYPQKIAAVLLTVLGGLAVLLAGVGLFSVLAYVVTQRAHEIGIRMALGARPQDVLTDVVRHALGMTVGGVAAGLVLAMAATPILKRLSLQGSQLLQGSATDPLVYAACAAFLVVVALLASSLPARRAARVDPMISLRYE